MGGRSFLQFTVPTRKLKRVQGTGQRRLERLPLVGRVARPPLAYLTSRVGHRGTDTYILVRAVFGKRWRRPRNAYPALQQTG